jgi:carboxymethylenebutenolidase
MEQIKVSDAIDGWVTGEKDSKRGVIVIQEWWGITPIIKDHAVTIAERCHARCLIPDIYHGKSTVDKEEASHLMNNLDWQRAVQEINECVEFLRRSGCGRVGVVGFCMGGALACAVAQHCKVDCAVAFYGTPPAGLAQPENVQVPIELHTGPLDDHTGFSDVATVEAWAGKCTTSKAYVDYEGCGHGFLNTGELAAELRAKMGFPTPPEDMQKRAWDRLAAFFEKYLG